MVNKIEADFVSTLKICFYLSACGCKYNSTTFWEMNDASNTSNREGTAWDLTVIKHLKQTIYLIHSSERETAPLRNFTENKKESKIGRLRISPVTYHK